MILGHSGIIKRKELQSSDVLVATRKRGVGVISAQKTQAEITWRKTDTGETGSGTLGTSWTLQPSLSPNGLDMTSIDKPSICVTPAALSHGIMWKEP